MNILIVILIILIILFIFWILFSKTNTPSSFTTSSFNKISQSERELDSLIRTYIIEDHCFSPTKEVTFDHMLNLCDKIGNYLSSYSSSSKDYVKERKAGLYSLRESNFESWYEHEIKATQILTGKIPHDYAGLQEEYCRLVSDLSTAHAQNNVTKTIILYDFIKQKKDDYLESILSYLAEQIS